MSMQETRPIEPLSQKNRMFFLKEEVFKKVEALAKRENEPLEIVVTKALRAYEAALEAETRVVNTGHTVSEIMAIVGKIGGAPVLFTPSFAFGGITLACREEDNVWELANEAWQISPTSEVLVEKWY